MENWVSPYLFYYTTAEHAIAILRERSLRFNTLSRCNDPFETKAWNFAVALSPPNWGNALGKREIPRLDEMPQIATRVIRAGWQVLCFTGSVRNDTQPSLQGACVPPMWAHYADNHKGACLILRWPEVHQAFEEINNVRAKAWGWVNYDGGLGLRNEQAFTLSLLELETKGLNLALEEHAMKYYQQFFLSKHTSWGYEQERRLLVKSEQPTAIPIDTAIRGIFVGSDCQPEHQSSFIEFGKSLNIEVRRMTWVNGNPLGGIHMLVPPDGTSRLFFYY